MAVQLNLTATVNVYCAKCWTIMPCVVDEEGDLLVSPCTLCESRAAKRERAGEMLDENGSKLAAELAAECKEMQAKLHELYGQE